MGMALEIKLLDNSASDPSVGSQGPNIASVSEFRANYGRENLRVIWLTRDLIQPGLKLESSFVIRGIFQNRESGPGLRRLVPTQGKEELFADLKLLDDSCWTRTGPLSSSQPLKRVLHFNPETTE